MQTAFFCDRSIVIFEILISYLMEFVCDLNLDSKKTAKKALTLAFRNLKHGPFKKPILDLMLGMGAVFGYKNIVFVWKYTICKVSKDKVAVHILYRSNDNASVLFFVKSSGF